MRDRSVRTACCLQALQSQERIVALAALALVWALGPGAARAQNAYFDVNGATAGYGVVNGGAYSWDDANWATVAGGGSPTANWIQGSFARFLGGTSGTAYTVTVNSDIQNVGFLMNVGGVTLTINAVGAGTLNVLPGVGSPPVQGIFAGNGGTLIINAPISGAGGVQPQSAGNIHFRGANTYSGGTKLSSGTTLVYFNNSASFGTGDISLALAGFVPFLGTGGTTITLPNNFVNTVINGGINFAADANTPVVSTGTWSLGTNNLQLRNNGPTTSPLTLSNTISGSGGITLSANNSGTIIFSGTNSYTGPTTISVGNTPVTLKLGAADTIATSSQVVFAGGILNPGGLNHTMTGTTVALGGTPTTSTIDFADGAAELAFADSSGVAWTAGKALNLVNWNPPSTRLRFGTDANGLTSAQLAQISFEGGGLGTAALDSEGYVVLPTGGPVITQQPQSTPTVCTNTPVAFTVAASGTGTLGYQWYRNNILMPGETNSSLSLIAGSPDAQNGDQYHVLVTEDNGTSSSNHATLSIFGPPTLSTQVYNATTVPGGTAAFAVAATSQATPATLTYQWYQAPSSVLTDGTLPSGTIVSGATTPTLTLTNVQAPEAGSYFATVTDDCGLAVNSVSGLLTVTAEPCGILFADADGDDDVDMDDFGAFQACYTGAVGGDLGLSDCRCFDVAGASGDVDSPDFAAFVACASGADVLANPDCAGAVLFEETFEIDPTAGWTLLKSTGANANDGGSLADFFFDYGAIGIPSAPNSSGGTTRGLKLQANLTGNVFSGLSVSPVGQSFTGSYALEFDMWLSHTGPLNPASFAASFNTNYGIMSDGFTTQWVGQAVTSIMFSSTNNGASVADYRVFTPATSSGGGYQDPYPNTSPVYAANYRSPAGAAIRDSAHPYYAFLGGATAPPAQLALFPTLTGATPVGSTGFTWRRVRIVKNVNHVLWYIDDHLMATVDTTTEGATSGTNILFGQGDPDAASPLDPDAAALDFALFDNIRVVRQ